MSCSTSLGAWPDGWASRAGTWLRSSRWRSCTTSASSPSPTPSCASRGRSTHVSELAHLAPAVRASHERWDGSGYPDGLAGYDIQMASRITFVCDAYDAMTSDRPYRVARSQIVAQAELLGGAGTQFCPHCADALVDELLERD